MSRQTKLQPKKPANVSYAQAANQSRPVSPSVESDDSPLATDTKALIRELTQNFSDIVEKKLSQISGTLDRISTALENQSTRITEAEHRVSEVEDTVSSFETRLAAAEKKIKVMAEGLDDMENRSRRDNIRVLNLREGVEGKQPIQFFESWLPTVLGLDASPGSKGRIKIDRAHRSFGPRSGRPRPVIIKLHNSRDKLRIMAAVRAKPNLECDGQRVFIHQDLSAAVREKRRSFNDVCQALIDKNIRFSMRFPATLTVSHNGTERKFETRREAETFVNALG